MPIWKASRKPAYYHYTANLYSEVSERVIEDWKSEDRERRNYEWKLEQRSIQDGTYGKPKTTRATTKAVQGNTLAPAERVPATASAS